MALSAIPAFALDTADDYVPEETQDEVVDDELESGEVENDDEAADDEDADDANVITATFVLVDPDEEADEFYMVCVDGETTIFISNDTPIYFEDYVPATEDDDCEELTLYARDVLFGRTLAEVLNNRNLRVLFCEDNYEIVSITILFEIAVHLGDDDGYIGIVTLPGEVDLDDNYLGDDDLIDGDDEVTPLPDDVDLDDFEPGDFDLLVLNGEVLVNYEIIEGAPHPFLHEDTIVMVPLRAVVEALDYTVSWNSYLRSVQLGVGIHLFIGETEVIVGRMAPIELSAPPVIVDDTTFVPLDFFRNVLGRTAYVFEGQVVVADYSDMY